MRRERHLSVAAGLGAFAQLALSAGALAGPHDALVARHAAANGVPEHLVHRVIRIESRGNAAAANAGNYGLMQIRLATARGVGYSGDAAGLLDPDTNLTYGVKYLAGAYRAAGCNADRAVSYYQRGYYGAQQFSCGATIPLLPLVQVAQAETKPDKAARKRAKDAARRGEEAAPAIDVIKPKVVRTETIGPAKHAPARPAGAFEPARIAPPPVAAKPEAGEPAAKFELASVPLPPARPDPDAAPKPDKKPGAKHAAHPPRPQPPHAEKKPKPDDSSPAVISFIKKLVTPDPAARKRQPSAEEASALPQVQPPQ